MQNAASHVAMTITKTDNAPFVVVEVLGGTPLANIDHHTNRLQALHRDIGVPSYLFVSLGANDRILFEAEFEANLHYFMASVNPSTKVYWIPPHNSAVQSLAGDMAGIVASVHSVAGQYPNMDVIDFQPTGRELSGDGVHLTVYGAAALSALIEEIIYE